MNRWILSFVIVVMALTPVSMSSRAYAAGTLVENVRSFIADIGSFLSGKKNVEADPRKTGVAPFAVQNTVQPMTSQQINDGVLQVNKTALDQPHRTSKDLEDWLQLALSEALSFDADTYEIYIRDRLPKGFSPAGLEEFKTWVTTTGIYDALKLNGRQLNGFVMERPFLLNEGVVNGRYRWLYEVPVMISFVPRGTTTYDKDPAVDSRKLIVMLQIGRVEESALDNNIQVETWSVKDNTRKN